MYTPEIVINGTKSFSGTKETTLREEIKNALAVPQMFKFSVVKDSLANDTLYISYNTSKDDQNAVFRLAITEDGISTKVEAGANASKTFVNNYVVRLLHSVNGIKKTTQIKIPVKKIKKSYKDLQIILVNLVINQENYFNLPKIELLVYLYNHICFDI